MARVLPLYREIPQLAVEREDATNPTSACTRCALHKDVRTVCMPPETSASSKKLGRTVLLFSDYPGGDEDRARRPMVGPAGQFLRGEVMKHWKGDTVIDNAVRCMPGKRAVTDKMVRQCRTYSAATIEDASPERIILLGSYAPYSILGRAPPVLSVRRGYTWLSDPLTPVFLMPNPAAARRNRFVRDWFEKDIKWALTCDIAELAKGIQWDAVVRVVQSKADCRKALEYAKAGPFVAYDFETAGKFFEPKGTKVEPPFVAVSVSIARPDVEDCWAWDREALADPDLRAGLREILEDKTIHKAGQNEKYDRVAASQLGIQVRGFKHDTRLMRKIAFADASAKLEDMQELVGMGGGKEEMQEHLDGIARKAKARPTKKMPKRGTDEWLEDTFGDDWRYARAIRDKRAKKHEQYSYALADQAIVVPYNARDARSTALLAAKTIAEFKKDDPALTRVWEDLVRPLSAAFAQMETWGVPVNKDAVEAFQAFTRLKQQDARMRIEGVATKFGLNDFDPSKPAHVRALLFEKLRLKPLRVSPKTGIPSCDEETLDALKDRHPICSDIVVWRKADKKRGTYADPLSVHLRSDGHVHPSILPDGARSGRPSCQNPNMFNIPRPEDDEARMARDCFAPHDPDNEELVQVDFSQLELRETAIESGDPNMRKIFLSGVDYHLRTAQMVSRRMWNKAPEELAQKGPERSAAKAINFGVLYGMGPQTLAANIGCSADDAVELMNAMFGAFPLLRKLVDSSLREARRYGYVWTSWDGKRFRRRPLWRVADADPESRSVAEHGSLNTKIQGKASDRCLFSIVDVVRWLKRTKSPAKLVLSVYDSLLFVTPKTFTDELVENATKIMLKWPSTGAAGRVPIVVDVERGPAWGSLEKVASYANMDVPNAITVKV